MTLSVVVAVSVVVDLNTEVLIADLDGCGANAVVICSEARRVRVSFIIIVLNVNLCCVVVGLESYERVRVGSESMI